jgi:hypothetical protein
MHGSESGGGKVFGRFAEPAHRVLDLAREEAERCGHRYLGPEHVLLGILVEGQSRAAQLLWSHGLEVTAARAALGGLTDRGVVPGPQPSDAQLLGTLGIDLDAVRRDSEQSFGVRAVGEATWRGDPPTWLAEPTGGVDAPVRPAAVRQAGSAAGQRPGTCPGPQPGSS